MQLSRRQLAGIGASLAAAVAFRSPARAQGAAPAGPFTLPPLGYAANANEAAIDARTMEIHHGAHHQAYVNNLNAAIGRAPQIGSKPLATLLRELGQVPEAERMVVRNNGGGHANHTMFWEIMGGPGGAPTGDVAAAIDRDLGGWDAFRAAFERAAIGQFGSGWAFVAIGAGGKLAIVAKPNQDTPLMDGDQVLLGNDVWEHAYYLRYQNRRAEYVRNWWNVLDWNRIGARYAAARAGTLVI
jgi:superoxide dismutase, Fe-Mn family